MSGSNSSLPPGARPAAADEPLGLTVHSLPNPQAAQRTVSGRWKMLAVLLVCAAPVVASYFTYYVIRPEGRHNYGELIDPQRPVPDLAVRDLDGAPANLRDLKGQWLFVSVAGGGCDEVCQKHLYLQRQLREGLGKEKERVDWVWLVSDDAPVADALRPALKGADVLRVPEAQLGAWLQPAPGQALRDHLYVVDPMGNWMMRFPAGLDVHGAAKAKRDLERLLRASASWDQPGR
ncbi:SCO family protein [Variovorax terrae]|uniref:Thioredoxin domain-containing protein n=1 Tax=Variovorax terrae TaxID=2923278 RepID=A0A9X1VUJ4_9BURK|nr:hypothetical protein [Variovorax terrae]MCJ0762122.1 hypothetical protein [Variovorax terrae]